MYIRKNHVLEDIMFLCLLHLTISSYLSLLYQFTFFICKMIALKKYHITSHGSASGWIRMEIFSDTYWFAPTLGKKNEKKKWKLHWLDKFIMLILMRFLLSFCFVSLHFKYNIMEQFFFFYLLDTVPLHNVVNAEQPGNDCHVGTTLLTPQGDARPPAISIAVDCFACTGTELMDDFLPNSATSSPSHMGSHLCGKFSTSFI